MASLRDLGLSEYEARAYRSLLRASPTTAKELSRASDVPMGRIYDVLNGLEQYGLARSQAASRPKKYVAVEPDVALDRLLADKREELEEQARQYESVVEELGEELEAAEPVEEQFWTAAVGAEETLDLLIERLSVAEERIVVVAGGDPTPQFDLGEVGERVADELSAALDRGVTVSVLLGPAIVHGVPPAVRDRYERMLAERPALEVRTADGVTGSFNLIDDVEVCIEVPNPLNPEEAFAMIDLKDPEFVEDVREVFEPRWAGAEPIELGAPLGDD